MEARSRVCTTRHWQTSAGQRPALHTAVLAEAPEHGVDEAVLDQAVTTPTPDEARDQAAGRQPQPEVDASQLTACKEFEAMVRTAPDQFRSGARVAGLNRPDQMQAWMGRQGCPIPVRRVRR